MKNNKHSGLCLSIGLAVLLAWPGSQAIASVITFDEATGGRSVNNNQSVGWQFNVLNPLIVTDLEWYDPTRSGLNTAHTVGIWDPTGALLTSAVIPAGASARQDGMFRSTSIPRVVLPVADGYIIGGENFAANTDRLACGSAGLCDGALDQTLNPALVFVNATFSTLGSGFTEPTFFSVAHEGFYGPSFSVVPEPGSILLLASGLLGIRIVLRRRPCRTGSTKQ